MQLVEQGDLLNVDGLSCPVIVVSSNFFNRSGKAVVCPILRRAAAGGGRRGRAARRAGLRPRGGISRQRRCLRAARLDHARALL